MRALRPYAFALLAVALAVCVALVAPHLGLGRLERPLLLITIGGVVWYGGTGPGVLAVIAGTAWIDFFFTLPVYRFAFERQDVISLALFAFFALVMGMFTAQRRNVELEDFVFARAQTIHSERRPRETRRQHTEASVARHVRQLFERLLSGFRLPPGLKVAELSVFTWPGYTAGQDPYEEVKAKGAASFEPICTLVAPCRGVCQRVAWA